MPHLPSAASIQVNRRGREVARWRHRRRRTGFNPKTQQKIKLPAKIVVKLRVAKAAKDGALGVKK
jgi:nucleoid DNA-binding protein